MGLTNLTRRIIDFAARRIRRERKVHNMLSRAEIERTRRIQAEQLAKLEKRFPPK